jgi:hypothetical protein
MVSLYHGVSTEMVGEIHHPLSRPRRADLLGRLAFNDPVQCAPLTPYYLFAARNASASSHPHQPRQWTVLRDPAEANLGPSGLLVRLGIDRGLSRICRRDRCVSGIHALNQARGKATSPLRAHPPRTRRGVDRHAGPAHHLRGHAAARRLATSYGSARSCQTPEKPHHSLKDFTSSLNARHRVPRATARLMLTPAATLWQVFGK